MSMKLPKLFVAGFNGFGQFKDDPTDVITSFTEWDYKAALELPSLIKPSVSSFHLICKFAYTAIAVDRTLYITGSLNDAFHQVHRHHFDDIITQIAGNDHYTCILLANGDLLKLKTNSTISPEKLSFLSTELSDPVSTESCQQQFVRNIYAGSTFSIALTYANDLYAIPTKVHTFPKHMRIRKICCGSEHTLVLTTNGDLYAFGSSARGQLGIGGLGHEDSPVLISALAGIKIVDIAAGHWHSAAVSAFGDLYTWGWNYNGQLGRPVYRCSTITFTSGRTETINEKLQSVFTQPEPITLSTNENDDDLDNQYNVVRVFAGHRHTIVLTECGSLLACGWNRYGQLAHNDVGNDIVQFRLMETGMAALGNLVDVICGDWCTVLMMDNCEGAEVKQI